MRPLIGITMNETAGFGADLRFQYYEAVGKAGGLAVALPPLDPALAPEMLARLDGLLLSGGGDIEPHHYHDTPLPNLGETEPRRDLWELALIGAAWQSRLPMLGVCRGMQALNVALGGDLWQDGGYMGDHLLPHQQEEPATVPTQAVRVLAPALAELLGAEQIMVNSHHHQMLRRMAPALQTAAEAADGVVEAVLPAPPYDGFCLGVQWHPERLNDELSHRLFAAFVRAASSIRSR